MTLRVVDTGVRPSRWNIAATAALTEFHRAGTIPDTVRFHQYPRSVLIGRHQELGREVDVEACRRRGVEIARRVTGGGAVYMSPAILAWDVVSGRSRLGTDLREAASRMAAIIAGGLRRLDLQARANAAGGVEIDGQKVSGSSGSFDGPTVLLQGTLLIDFDRADMAHLLKAHASRVASLADFLGRVPSVQDVRSALLAEMSEAWRAPPAAEDLGPEELALADALLATEIGTEAFVIGETAEAETPLSTPATSP